jgi:thiamine monophosphate synthase
VEVQEDNGNHHSISGELNRHHAASTHASDSEPSTAHAAPDSAAAHTHGLGQTFHFKDKISASAASDVLDYIGVSPIAASTGHSGNAADGNGPPTISELAQSIELPPSTHHSPDNLSHGLGHVAHVHAHGAHDLMV